MALSDDYYSQLYDWWYKLNIDTEDRNADRASRAKLRRCKNLSEIALEPAFLNLCFQLKISASKNLSLTKLAVIVGLLSHVKYLTKKGKITLATQMAMASDKKNNVPVKEIRFKKLLRCQTREELFPVLLRIIPLIKGKVDLKSLVNGVYYWGDNKKREWAYAYYYKLQSTEDKSAKKDKA